MRWKFNPTGHDHRQIDLVVIIALLVVIVGAWRYLEDRASSPPNHAAFIVPESDRPLVTIPRAELGKSFLQILIPRCRLARA